jgi:peptidoglycan hydrolase-like protein with peptidoglycan-binding domain
VADEPFFLFEEEDFAWDEPAISEVAAAVAIPVTPPFRPRPRRRRRQARTFAGDLARVRDALGLGPFALAGLFAVLVAAAVAGRILVGGGSEAPATQPARTKPVSEAPQTTGQPTVSEPAVAKTFEQGDTGAGVRDLQAALTALGYYAQAPDGGYGSGTSSAVSSFQGDHGLIVDGVAGPETARTLVTAVAEQATEDVEAIQRGLDAAVAERRITERAATRYSAAASETLARLASLTPGRSAAVGVVLNDIAAQADAYDAPRARALFSAPDSVADYLAANPLPSKLTDIDGEDGVVYRYFPAHGFAFHPLANFARLNKLVRRGRDAEARKLAGALVARGVPVGDALTWEYYFAFGGPSRWTSALAQSVGAQALAHAGSTLADPSLLREAAGAYKAIPQTLAMPLGGGIWIREYSYSDMAILNAQLQSIVSLSQYEKLTGDAGAADLVAQMSTAARTLLPEFDTGCWSRYSLGGSPANEGYHRYHVSLLEKLARDTGDPVWRETWLRWKGYLEARGC